MDIINLTERIANALNDAYSIDDIDQAELIDTIIAMLFDMDSLIQSIGRSDTSKLYLFASITHTMRDAVLISRTIPNHQIVRLLARIQNIRNDMNPIIAEYVRSLNGIDNTRIDHHNNFDPIRWQVLRAFPIGEVCVICQGNRYVPDDMVGQPLANEEILKHVSCMCFIHKTCLIKSYNTAYNGNELIYPLRLNCPMCRNAFGGLKYRPNY
jgi:hypothetical protein